jgi:hypothetical protein
MKTTPMFDPLSMFVGGCCALIPAIFVVQMLLPEIVVHSTPVVKQVVPYMCGRVM